MVKRYIIVQTSTNKKNIANKISKYLLENHLAACVTIILSAQSQYYYKDSFIKDKEFLIHIKTKKNNFLKIQKVIEELHNYETPEIIAIDIIMGSKKFLKWIDNEIDV